jgi:hypothetical protein
LAGDVPIASPLALASSESEATDKLGFATLARRIQNATVTAPEYCAIG